MKLPLLFRRTRLSQLCTILIKTLRVSSTLSRTLQRALTQQSLTKTSLTQWPCTRTLCTSENTSRRTRKTTFSKETLVWTLKIPLNLKKAKMQRHLKSRGTSMPNNRTSKANRQAMTQTLNCSKYMTCQQ